MGKLDTIIKKVFIGSKKNKVNETDIYSVVEGCRDEIQSAEDSGIMPSPKYFEQAALLSRIERKYDNEIAICSMYIDLANAYIAKNELSKNDISEKVLPVCVPLIKRLHNAETMLTRTHIGMK